MQSIIKAILAIVTLLPVELQAALLPTLDLLWEEIDQQNLQIENLGTYAASLETVVRGKNNTLEEQAKWLEDMKQDCRIHGLALERAEKEKKVAEGEFAAACNEINSLNTSIDHHCTIIQDLKDEVGDLTVTCHQHEKAYVGLEQQHSKLLEENRELKMQILDMGDKLHKEELTCSKAIDDLARMSEAILADETTLEKMVAATVLSGPSPRAVRLIQAVWSNDPSGVWSNTVSPGNINDFIKKSCKKYN